MKLFCLQPAPGSPGDVSKLSVRSRSCWLVLAVTTLFISSAIHGQTASTPNACDAAQTTAAMRSCADAEYKKADAELNTVYQAALKAEDAAGKRNMVAAEAAWIRFRDAEAFYQAGKAAGGTLAPLLRVTALTQLTQARIAQLRTDSTHP